MTLILKVDYPSRLGGFQFISLVSSFYKLIDKFLIGRLFGVMDKLISFNQSTFLKGGFLVDRVVFVNELVDLMKRSKKTCSFLK